MQRLHVIFTVCLLLLAIVLPASAQENMPLEAADVSEPNPTLIRLEELGSYPCMDGLLQCVTLTQPLDHNNPEDDRTIDVVFTVLPATGERKGTFAIIVGGPGGSGVESASQYFGEMGRFDPRLNEYYDIVMVDPRGIGLSQGGYDLDCPSVFIDFSLRQELGLTETSETRLIEETRRFAEACLEEMDQAIIPFLGTNQVIADLEAIFEAIGADEVWLYGESYGTQVVQLYATQYPERIQALIIDGVVDLTLTGPQYYESVVDRTQAIIQEYLEACNAMPACAADFNGDAIAAYNALHEKLADNPVEVNFPLPNGQTESRTFTLEDLLSVTSQMNSSILRWLAAAVQGDFVPLMRVRYLLGQLDAQTIMVPPFYLDTPYPDNVGYYNVDCTDYFFFEGTSEEQAQAFIEAGDALEKRYPLRNVRGFYNNLMCAFWPTQGSIERPAPFVGSEDYPTFVLNGTDDQATPVTNGYSVFANIENAFMITRRGGDHVIFGRGDACPDQLLMSYLVEDVLPTERQYLCTNALVDDYAPILNTAPIGTTPETLMLAVKTEIQHLPELLLQSNMLVGCPAGGVLSTAVDPITRQIQLIFADCAFWEELRLTGSGTFRIDSSTHSMLQLDVFVQGSYEGWVTFFHDSTLGLLTLDGELNGESLHPIP